MGHVIVDGPVQDEERSKKWGRPMSEMISPDAVSEIFLGRREEGAVC